MLRNFMIALATLLCLTLASEVFAQGSSLTYQGSLEDAGQPAQGNHDFLFTLFNSVGSPVSSTNTRNGVPVVGGLFSVELNFGSLVFDGSERFLEIAVRRPGETEFTTLSPRSPVTPAPYAQLASRALTASEASSAQRLVSTGTDATIRISDQITARFGPIDAEGNIKVSFGHPTNSASGTAATVGGGGANQSGLISNRASGDFSTVAGGATNRASGGESVVSGGTRNTASGEGSVVSGGTRNIASGDESTIGGGAENEAIGLRATVSGGGLNQAVGGSAAVGGGAFNYAVGNLSTVSGGLRNCAGGAHSWAGGSRAKVRPAVEPTGLFNSCKDLGSYPGGDGDVGTFVWADRSGFDNNPFISTGSNQFLVRAEGGMGVGTNAPAAQLHVQSTGTTAAILERTSGNVSLSFRENGSARGQITGFSDDTFMLRSEGIIQLRTGGNNTRFQLSSTGSLSLARGPNDADADKAIQVGSNTSTGNGAHLTNTGVWTNASSRSFKHAFEALDPVAVLEQVVNLPVTRWSYRGQDEIRHIGPTAEDFHAAFGLGGDERYIGAVDADGVALAAIQGLNARLEAQNSALKDELHAVRAEVASLRDREHHEIETLRAELAMLRELITPRISGRTK